MRSPWTALLWAAAIGASALPSLNRNFQAPFSLPDPDEPTYATKRIAIVGAGAGGIAALKALAELPERMRRGWHIVAFEQRDAVGGIWVPDDNVPQPPATPETPLYPVLRTNSPHPIMTMPQTSFPPETPLIARHGQVLRYYQDIVAQYDLSRYIKLRQSVLSARWIGSPAAGYWNLTVKDLDRGTTTSHSFDHLIAAPGFNHFPRFVHFRGEDDWRARNKTIVHCMYFRDPAAFSGQNVVVVGGGPSGWDMTRHIVKHAKSVYWSRYTQEERPRNPRFPDVPNVSNVAHVTSLVNGTVTLGDGTQLHGIDTLMLATGYDVRVLFLDHLVEGKQRPANVYTTSTNLRYIRPLYEHTLSLDDSYPLGALYFCGILSYNPTGMTNYAQALFAAYTIADPSILLSREEFYAALVAREKRVVQEGENLEHWGHRVNFGYGPYDGHNAEGSFDDLMVDFIRERGYYAGYPGIPPTGLNYTETWRVANMRYAMDIVLAWYAGLAKEGDAWDARWAKGRRTEADYVSDMQDVMNWWRKEKENGTATSV
ncbi:FAD/NAD(P)-binding domain-containing protein [Auricularia subglabra TFB-10046 SS5]|nr:FAD/NAD(P)-binding domain-containing protein [Auricularia subglabra TFB-10046 SS5]